MGATDYELCGFKSKNSLITGAAGFIGSNLVKRLYADVYDVTVIGIDNMNDYLSCYFMLTLMSTQQTAAKFKGQKRILLLTR